MPDSFHTRLMGILDDMGLKQADLCRMTGLKSSNFAKYAQNPNSTPTLSTATKIADALGISLDYLAGRDGYGKHGPLSVSMAPDEKKLVDDYRECTPRERQAIANMASTMADDGNAKNMDAAGSAAMGA